MTAFAGMLTATMVGVVLVPGLFVLVERYLVRKRKHTMSTVAGPANEEAKP